MTSDQQPDSEPICLPERPLLADKLTGYDAVMEEHLDTIVTGSREDFAELLEHHFELVESAHIEAGASPYDAVDRGRDSCERWLPKLARSSHAETPAGLLLDLYECVTAIRRRKRMALQLAAMKPPAEKTPAHPTEGTVLIEEQRAARRQAVLAPRLKKKGLSNEAWAIEAEVDYGTVRLFMNGTTKTMTPKKRRSLAKVIGMEPIEFPE